MYCQTLLCANLFKALLPLEKVIPRVAGTIKLSGKLGGHCSSVSCIWTTAARLGSWFQNKMQPGNLPNESSEGYLCWQDL